MSNQEPCKNCGSESGCDCAENADDPIWLQANRRMQKAQKRCGYAVLRNTKPSNPVNPKYSAIRARIIESQRDDVAQVVWKCRDRKHTAWDDEATSVKNECQKMADAVVAFLGVRHMDLACQIAEMHGLMTEAVRAFGEWGDNILHKNSAAFVVLRHMQEYLKETIK